MNLEFFGVDVGEFLLATVVLIVIFVQIIQSVFSWLSKAIDKRLK